MTGLLSCGALLAIAPSRWFSQIGADRRVPAWPVSSASYTADIAGATASPARRPILTCSSTAGNPALRSCDPALFGQLKRLLYPAGRLAQAHRQVIEIERRGILPPATVYHSGSLAYPDAMRRPARAALRQRWLQSALEATAPADAVFLDPDNGLSETVAPLSRKGPKYVFADDLQRFWGRGQSLIIYHHLGRQGRAAEQIRRVSAILTERLGLPSPPWALWYHRGTARVYFIIAQKAHEPGLARRLAAFQAGPWCRRPAPHFEFVGRIPPADELRLL